MNGSAKFLSVIVSLLFIPCLFADEVKLTGMRYGITEDFQCIHTYLLTSIETGKVYEYIPGKTTLPADVEPWLRGFEWKDLLVSTPRILPPDVETIEFTLTPRIKDYREKLQAIADYHNDKSGSSKKPKIIITDEVERMTTDTAQFYRDGRNTIVTTPQDRYHRIDYVSAYVEVQLEVVIKEDQLYRSEEDGKLYSPEFKILESDIYAKTYLMDYSSYLPLIFFHELGHIFNYYHTSYTDDYMGARWSLDGVTSPEQLRDIHWQMNRERDRIYFPEEGDDTARLFPVDGQIYMLFTAYHEPNEGALDVAHFLTAITNLKAYPGKPLTLTMYDGWLKRLDRKKAKRRKLFSISGDGSNLVSPLTDELEMDEPVYREYPLSMLHIGKESAYDKLTDLLARKGRDRLLGYERRGDAAKVTLTVEGYLHEDDKEPTLIKRFIWIAFKDVPTE